MIFTCNTHWIEEICDTPANYWPAGTPQAERDFKAKLNGTGVRDSCGKSVSKGDPTGFKDAEGGQPAESECPTFQSTSIKERERISF